MSLIFTLLSSLVQRSVCSVYFLPESILTVLFLKYEYVAVPFNVIIYCDT